MPTSMVTRWPSTCRSSDEAQAEARDIMAANRNLLKPADGTPILHIEQDMVLGCYYLTYERPSATVGKPRVFIDISKKP